MLNTTRLLAAGCAALLLHAAPARAEDIDLFNANPDIEEQRPNVLIMLDNAAANNSAITQLCPADPGGDKLAMIRSTLIRLLNPTASTFCVGSPAADLTAAQKQELLDVVKSVNIGLMIFNPSGSGQGGYVRYHVRPMDVDANRSGLIARLDEVVPTTETVVECADPVPGPGACQDGAVATGLLTCPASITPADLKCVSSVTQGVCSTTPPRTERICKNCNPNFDPAVYPPGTTCTNITISVDDSGATCPGNNARQVEIPATSSCTSDTAIVITDLTGAVGIPQANNAPYAKSMYEAWQYFGAKPAYVGFDSSNYDAAARAGANYVSPAGQACQKNFIIFVGTGGPDSGEDNPAQALLTGIGGTLPTDPIPFTPSNYTSNWFDEFARTLKTKDVVPGLAGNQNIITYTIAVHNPADGNDNTAPNVSARSLLASGANKGGGRYFDASSAEKFLEAMKTIFLEVQAVNSVFASVTLPVSVNVRGTNLNQVYMGVFRPDADSNPRWFGNLKQYQLALDLATNQAYLADSSGTLNITSPITGFVVDDAVSFWTTPSVFWQFNPLGNPPSASDSPDGPNVEKGGAAQRLRSIYTADGAGSRRVYTCIGCAPGTALGSSGATLFDDANGAITEPMLGAADATERTAIINWVRGQDTKDENGNFSTGDVRASVHGDVLHSRPAVVNYNRGADDNDVAVFYGSNDGLIRAVKGGQVATDGYELWSFVAEEFITRLKRSYDNSPAITAANRKTYFADGTVSIYQNDANSDGRLDAGAGDQVIAYYTMRRGGRIIYAFDVSDPGAPRFLWKRGCPSLADNTGCTAGWEELGQSWSAAQVTNIKNGDGSKRPVLVFGAGYDPAVEDIDPNDLTVNDGTTVNGTPRSMGRGIFVVDALNGDLIWRAGRDAGASLQVSGMDYSIPADLAILVQLRGETNDGVMDRIYTGDTGGNVWRVSIVNPADTGTWTVNRLASLPSPLLAKRKFLFTPSVVFATDVDGDAFDAVLLGSGDREHPFDTTTINRFFMLKDPDIGREIPSPPNPVILLGDLYDATTDVIGTSPDQAQVNAAKTTLGGKKGWHIRLGVGEKTVGDALTVGGATIFATNQPGGAGIACASSLGIARIYRVNFLTAATFEPGAPRFTEIAGGGFLPSPVRAVVRLPGAGGTTVTKSVVLLGPQVTPGGTSQLERRTKVYWYKEVE